MGLDIGGHTITQASSILTINTGVTASQILSAGGVTRPVQPLFSATGSAAWVYWSTENQWNKPTLPTAIVNYNSCYSTTLYRFTAPVAGRYFFQSSLHLLKDLANNGYYFHPTFAVNGSLYIRNVNTSYVNYRLRGHGQPIAMYCWGQQAAAYDLLAGDYVEPMYYSTGGWNGTNGNRYYPGYSRFTGFLMG